MCKSFRRWMTTKKGIEQYYLYKTRALSPGKCQQAVKVTASKKVLPKYFVTTSTKATLSCINPVIEIKGNPNFLFGDLTRLFTVQNCRHKKKLPSHKANSTHPPGWVKNVQYCRVRVESLH